MIDISKMDKAEVLAKLYNASKAQGMGMLQFVPGDMSVEEAREFLKKGTNDLGFRTVPMRFDYLQGRVMKVDLSGEQINEQLYDRDLGEGAAARALGVDTPKPGA